MISLVITSFNRRDLLDRTIRSLGQYCDDIFDDIIIVEDSGNTGMNDYISKNYPDYRLILHEKNKGAYESIDEAYSFVKSPYVLHVEDDWEFYEGDFIRKALIVLESNPMIMQVNLSNEQNMPIEPEVFKAKEVEYRIVGTDSNGWWHGFTCNPSVRSMAAYNMTKPWIKWAVGNDLSIKECMVGQRYFELGYKAVVLNEYFCKHTGVGRGTWQLQ